MPRRYVKPLSASNEAVLRFVKLYIKYNGYSPTRREISAGTGTPPSNVQHHLKRLSKLGYIRLGSHGRIAVVELMDQIEQYRIANRLLHEAATRWREIAEARRCQ